MSEFDDGLHLRRVWNHLPVAKRPVAAASSAGAAGAHVCTDKNNEDVIDESEPRKRPKSAIAVGQNVMCGCVLYCAGH